MIALTILGSPATKKTSNRLVKAGGRSVVLPSAAYRKFEAIALPQLRQQMAARRLKTITAPVNICATFYLAADYQSDVHGYYQALADVLVKAGVLEDDNRRIVVGWDGSRCLVDRVRPRVMVQIERVSSPREAA